MMNKRTWLGALLAFGAAAALSGGTAMAEDDQAAVYSKNGADTCLRCHGDDMAVMGIFRSAHAQPNNPRSPFGHGQLQCESCHGPGAAHTKRPKKGEERAPVIQFGRDKPTPVRQQNAMCTGCHNADTGSWHASAHDANDVGCADCHNSHEPRDPVLAKATQAEVCGTCHQVQQANMLLPFSHPLRDGQMDCTSCHAPHGSQSQASLNKDTVNDTCYQCHAEQRGPFLWEHQPVSEDCGLCHRPHGSVQPGMVTQRSPFLCQQCHGQQGHPSVPGLPAGLPGGSVNISLLAGGCANCHSQVHGSNHPSGSKLMR